jgi:hypothetical protein
MRIGLLHRDNLRQQPLKRRLGARGIRQPPDSDFEGALAAIATSGLSGSDAI